MLNSNSFQLKKTIQICICLFSVKQTAFIRKGDVKTGWLGIRIMCPSGAKCLPAESCMTNYHYKDPIKCVALVHNGYHYHFIESKLFSL